MRSVHYSLSSESKKLAFKSILRLCVQPVDTIACTDSGVAVPHYSVPHQNADNTDSNLIVCMHRWPCVSAKKDFSSLVFNGNPHLHWPGLYLDRLLQSEMKQDSSRSRSLIISDQVPQPENTCAVSPSTCG